MTEFFESTFAEKNVLHQSNTTIKRVKNLASIKRGKPW